MQERWGDDNLNWVKNVPWNKWAGDEDADGEIPEEKLVEPAVVGQRVPEVVFVNTREKEPREFYISKADAEKHGYTRGCGGCSTQAASSRSQNALIPFLNNLANQGPGGTYKLLV